MEVLMFFLSFPASIFFFLWAPVIYGWEGIHAPGDYFLLWLGAFVVGYVQWFVLVPRIFAMPLITSLGLNEPVTLKPRSRRRKKKGKRHLTPNQPKPFDEDGKSPLERLISAD